MEIDVLSSYYLILRYPAISSYIQEAFDRGDYEDLMDFLFELETEPEPQFN